MNQPSDSNRSSKSRSDGDGQAGPKRSTTSRLQRPVRVTETVSVEDSESSEAIVRQRFRKRFDEMVGTLLSFLIHSAILLALAFYVFQSKPDPRLGLVAELVEPTETIEHKAADQQPIVKIAAKEPEESLKQADATDHSILPEITLPKISDANDIESAEDLSPVENTAPVVPSAAATIGGGLEGRQGGSRSSLAAENGGSAQSELAVENGLKWLADHQHDSGGWRLKFSGGDCDGRCRNDGRQESTTAATGLALMAFLGAGYTHKSGPYKREVQDGLDYLRGRMRKSYYGGNLAEGAKKMYSQGIATIALCEAFNMTKDEQLRPVVESALEYIVTAQHSAGGWRYEPAAPGDITVTGWQMMAIKSCELAGIEVPAETIKKAKAFLKSVSDESAGLFGYQSKKSDPNSTAVGLLLTLYITQSRDHVATSEGIRYVVENGPSPNNVYFNYYATQLLFHAQHRDWDNWNKQMRDYLIQTQAKTGHETGSWFFREQYGSVGGRLYTTALAVMILEVYYRYLPLFDNETITSDP